MNSRKLRETIGLPQRFLAAWLGISRDLLAQDEIGNREVPYSSKQLFYQLQDIMNTLPNEEPELRKPLTDEKRARKLHQKIRLLRHQIQHEENKITDLKESMDKQKKALLFCQTLEKISFFKDVGAQMGLDLFQYKTQRAYIRSGPRALKKMEFYLKQKKDECAFLEEWVKEFE